MKLTLKKFLIKKWLWDEYLETCRHQYSRKEECLKKEKMYDNILERVDNWERQVDIAIELWVTHQAIASAMRSAKIRKYEKLSLTK